MKNQIKFERMLATAIEIAMKYHSGQTDKIGSPYIFHPMRVMESVSGLKYKIVAILHDVIEDTDATLDTLNNAGIDDGEILSAIDIITKKKKQGQSYEEYLRLVNNNTIARKVKLVDIADNLSPERIYKVPLEECIKLLKKYHIALRVLNEFSED
jgi:GTP diphosphokinase / guanosine-3',5'-bis(diphosphate) 3'-diphosphatase